MSFTTDASGVEPQLLATPKSPVTAAPDADALDADTADSDTTDSDASQSAESPLAAVPPLLRAALEKRGFTRLTEVQEAVLRAQAGTDVAHARDLRISSQTGSGKTVAIGFALAPQLMAQLATAPAKSGPSALLIAPTRELADQIRNELEWLFADLRGVSIECVTGGTSVLQEQRRLHRRPRVVVGTPGRLLDHIRSKALDCSSISQLVLDEADQMLDLGFREDLDAIVEALPASRRTHMVSATFPPEVKSLVERFQSKPLSIEGTRLGTANVDIEHVACRVHARERYAALVNLLLMQDGERTLVFVRTRQDTGELAEQLAKDGFSALPLSGELAQAQRTRTLNAFRTGVVTTLIATDVAARGLDVPDVNVVVHFDLPMDDGVYTHRSGRTGRAGRKGKSIVLVPPSGAYRVQRMLRQAKVVMQWGDAPGPSQVGAFLAERERARLVELLDASAAPSASDCDFARATLASRDPVQVVARLLANARSQSKRAPMPITNASSRPLPSRSDTFQSSNPTRPTKFSIPTPHPTRGPRLPGGSSRPSGRAEAYVRFAINWGTRKGATPQRLLAHVCRRGEIAGHQIGVITVQPHSATFEVDAQVAGAFAALARKPDPREPHLVIARDDGRN